MVVHKRVQKNFTLKNLDSRVEPFTYPLFFSKGRLGFSVDMPIKTPYASRQHLTRFEMAQYRIAFPPHLTKNLHSQADCVWFLICEKLNSMPCILEAGFFSSISWIRMFDWNAIVFSRSRTIKRRYMLRNT